MRICVAGAGLAGTLLAWRLTAHPEVERIDLLLGEDRHHDATQASGGAVRAYETHPRQRSLAIEALGELLGSPVLRDWSGFRMSPSMYLQPAAPGLPAALAEIESAFPGSARLVDQRELPELGWAELPSGTVGILERCAGEIAPARLREAVLAELSRRPHVGLWPVPLQAVLAGVGGTVGALAQGTGRSYDALVIAAGAWTPNVLRGNGLPGGGYCTKSIQYAKYAAQGWRPPTFVDETTGLYGKPVPGGGLLLGVATEEWDVAPGRGEVTEGAQQTAAQLAALRMPRLQLGPVLASVAASDCYCDPPVLALRPVGDGQGPVWTFTGGSGGSAKTALAASRRAAERLVRVPCAAGAPRFRAPDTAPIPAAMQGAVC